MESVKTFGRRSELPSFSKLPFKDLNLRKMHVGEHRNLTSAKSFKGEVWGGRAPPSKSSFFEKEPQNAMSNL